MKDIKLPTFLVIGAAKCGTTALYHYLKQHPQIHMSPVLEPKFFEFADGKMTGFNGPGDRNANSHVTTDLESYSKLFEASENEIAQGESSPSYLYCEGVPERIKETIPDVKIIAILRHPVERAYSNYLHLYASGREPITDFEQALNAEQERMDKDWEYFWHYKRQGFYSKKLKKYFDIFDRDQIKVFLYEDYRANPQAVLKEIFEFINVDETFVPNFEQKHNVTSFAKSRTLVNLMTQPNPIKSIVKPLIPSGIRSKIFFSVKDKMMTNKKPKLSQSAKEYLLDEYREDILNLQGLLQKDLSHWLEVSKIKY
ncbi:sulfotransferase [Lusitaniella coriacea LEGE 07157]|uniref:Sulfotransferase n=1 Tax=Lusitaniella coriacea LEGE 07157 TaxID=945747 RepID=A0A8J7DWT3_9CYAN|nr:sulfotransferase [Lusitaniella coriacea]MBE9116300.1 sulfotransferase [Lusitaniella coriacea LEGE 07157]